MTEDKYINKKLKPFKTSCCKAKAYKRGRADLRCSVCDKDSTFEILLLSQMFSTEYKLKYELEK